MMTRDFIARARAISTSCCWPIEQIGDARPRRAVEAERPSDALGVVVDAAAEQTQRAAADRLVAEKDIAGHVEVLRQVQFLVDEDDAQDAAHAPRRGGGPPLPSMEIVPASGV